ncbi:unnamed protein product [Pleuronectes platessa]|uniref:Uncharacterized protein n=1 Tax=Pleuronectes platessa TaxID=8262 RepID=A0A9N7VMH7_PLEPL|nr:unnamed protein product [Pleuronectes platessa]
MRGKQITTTHHSERRAGRTGRGGEGRGGEGGEDETCLPACLLPAPHQCPVRETYTTKAEAEVSEPGMRSRPLAVSEPSAQMTRAALEHLEFHHPCSASSELCAISQFQMICL